MTLSLRDLGEDALLARMLPRLPPAPAALLGPGDDAAVVAAPDGRVVATTDVLVQDRDFRLDWSSPADIGWKAGAQNLADVAAMGARPTALLVALAAPPSLGVDWVLELADGLAEVCAGTGAGVVGGDLSSSREIVLSVTALGDLQGRDPVRRSGARPGDVLALAGGAGRSAAGLALLRAGRPAADPAMVEAHRRPTPPLGAGPLAASSGATAMLDVSDGLLRDLGRLARASDVLVDLTGSALGAFTRPLAAAAAIVDGRPLQWVLTGGEDHGLAACFRAGTAIPHPFRPIGQVLPAAAAGGPGVLLDGQDASYLGSGWDHFRP